MNRNYAVVAGRAGHRCEYCRAPEAIFNLPFEVEHIVPSSEGGTDEVDNLALACRSCNLFKSNLQKALDVVTGEIVRLFHPRSDRWDEHFQFEPDGEFLRGLTTIGRATVAALQMNGEAQRRPRKGWAALGIYP